jgi:hypothetical protein
MVLVVVAVACPELVEAVSFQLPLASRFQLPVVPSPRLKLVRRFRLS